MAQKDWEEVRQIIDVQSSGFLEKFLISDQVFLPNDISPNPFNADHSNFSASDLGKSSPGQWIPVYYLKDISEYFRDNQKDKGDRQNKIYTACSLQYKDIYFKHLKGNLEKAFSSKEIA